MAEDNPDELKKFLQEMVNFHGELYDYEAKQGDPKKCTPKGQYWHFPFGQIKENFHVREREELVQSMVQNDLDYRPLLVVYAMDPKKHTKPLDSQGLIDIRNKYVKEHPE